MTNVGNRLGGARWVHACDGLLDAGVVLFAAWTVVYHVCLVARWGVPVALSLELVVLLATAGGWFLLVRRRRGASTGSVRSHADVEDPHLGARDTVRPPYVTQRRELVLGAVTIACAVVAAAGMALSLAWTLVWIAWLSTAVTALGAAVLAVRRRIGSPLAPEQEVGEGAGLVADEVADRTGAVVAVVWALALGVFTLFVRRPNPDDVYYVNFAQWIAEHGNFPVRDTIFANLVYPMSSWPPIASYEALAGSAAYVVDSRAATVMYIVAPPLATFLSVLALFRLLRAWRVRSVAIGLSVALAFLLLDGSGGFAPGNLFLTRIFQGKVVFVCLFVPLLFVYCLRYVERPTRRHAGWLAVCGVAAVGSTTSAMFLVPLVALAGMAPLAIRRPKLAAEGFLATSAYALAAGVMTKAVGGRSADNFSHKGERFDGAWFGHMIFTDGILALLTLGLALTALLFIPHPAARVSASVAVLMVGVTFVPGVTQLSFDLIGLGPTLWRVSWLLVAAALVAVTTLAAAERFPRIALRWGVPALVLALLAVFGTPIWNGSTSTRIAAPFHYQRSPESLEIANRLIRDSPPGARVLGPQDLGVTIAVLTTRIHAISPRDYFLNYLSDDPRFHYADRVALTEFVNQVLHFRRDQIEHSLKVLHVATVCVKPTRSQRVQVLKEFGYTPSMSNDEFTCLTRDRKGGHASAPR